MRRDNDLVKLVLDFLYRTWPGMIAVVASFVWKASSTSCIATAVFWSFFGVLVVAFVGISMYTLWTMARAAAVSEEEYQSVGGGAVIVVLVVLSLWYALFCEGA